MPVTPVVRRPSPTVDVSTAIGECGSATGRRRLRISVASFTAETCPCGADCTATVVDRRRTYGDRQMRVGDRSAVLQVFTVLDSSDHQSRSPFDRPVGFQSETGRLLLRIFRSAACTARAIEKKSVTNEKKKKRHSLLYSVTSGGSLSCIPQCLPTRVSSAVRHSQECERHAHVTLSISIFAPFSLPLSGAYIFFKKNTCVRYYGSAGASSLRARSSFSLFLIAVTQITLFPPRVPILISATASSARIPVPPIRALCRTLPARDGSN